MELINGKIYFIDAEFNTTTQVQTIKKMRGKKDVVNTETVLLNSVPLKNVIWTANKDKVFSRKKDIENAINKCFGSIKDYPKSIKLKNIKVIKCLGDGYKLAKAKSQNNNNIKTVKKADVIRNSVTGVYE